MKTTTLVNLLAIGLAISFVAGCQKRPTPLTQIPKNKFGQPIDIGQGNPAGLGNPTGETGGVTGTGTPATPTGTPSNDPHMRADWKRDNSILAIDTVYFAYDSSVVRESEKSKVSAVADYLKSNPNAAVEVQGNCDERGTEEYNRALGERRALALREELISLGAEASRVDTISFGKDRPAQEGHDESAWSKNRRGEFAVEVPPM